MTSHYSPTLSAKQRIAILAAVRRAAVAGRPVPPHVLMDELNFFRDAGRPVLEPEARGKEPTE